MALLNNDHVEWIKFNDRLTQLHELSVEVGVIISKRDPIKIAPFNIFLVSINEEIQVLKDSVEEYRNAISE